MNTSPLDIENIGEQRSISNWKTMTNVNGQRFPFIDHCQAEPFLEPFDELTYQAWGDFLALEIKDGQLGKVYKGLGNELTPDHQSIGKFCDWITENYWGLRNE